MKQIKYLGQIIDLNGRRLDSERVKAKTIFQKIKSYLLSDLSLAHFDPKKEIVVASDASNYGIEAVILHKFEDRTTKPIVHVSRSLLPPEKISQIEKESLAIIYAIKIFHMFIHERKFTLQTDHRLLTIFGSKYAHCQQVTALGNNLELQL